MTNLEIVTSKDHTLSCLSIRSFLLRMSAFLYLTNRMRNSFDEDDIFGNKDEQSDHSKYHASYTLQRYNFWNSNSFIWDFILISFRHYWSPGGLHKTMHDDFLRPDSYYLEHATLLIESFEQIIDIFIYCVNRNDNLREAKKLEQSTPVDNTNRTDMDVVMDDTNVLGALNAQESSSLRDLTLSYTRSPNTRQRYNFWNKHQKMIFCGNGDEQSLHSGISCSKYMTKIKLLNQASEKDILRQWGWTISTFRNIMLQIHDKDTTSETNIRKWYFSAMRMNNLMFRNIMLQTHNKDTTKQVSKTSFRRWYFRQWRWTIWCSEISWKRNNSVVQRWIFDKYLSTHTSTIFVTSRQKNIHPGQLKNYLSEGYAVDAVGSTSSKLEIFCLALLFHKK